MDEVYVELQKHENIIILIDEFWNKLFLLILLLLINISCQGLLKKIDKKKTHN
jgi:hypothetical protein